MCPMTNDELIKYLGKLPKRLTRGEAALILGVKVRTMEEWHRKGLPPKAIKNGVRGIRYCEHEVLELRDKRHEGSN